MLQPFSWMEEGGICVFECFGVMRIVSVLSAFNSSLL